MKRPTASTTFTGIQPLLAVSIAWSIGIAAPGSLWSCVASDTDANAPTEAAQATENEHPGAKIYRERCASCHGADGQGVREEYDEPLFGSRSLSSLARLIERTMPEDEPELCEGDDAARVAEYIYHEFYSLEARHRKGLIPQVELSRLTVPQYRNTIADLLLKFTPPPPKDQTLAQPEEGKDPTAPEILPGLSAQYYQSKGMNKANELHLERVDHRIDFDFGTGSPTEEIASDQFAIVWQGAFIANETGHYEFRVRTPNGARLYLNSENTGTRRRMRDDSSLAGQAALIDAWVSSGKMREHSARTFLLGGRRYPLRLEFFKYKEEMASIQLEWKQPDGAWTILDRNQVNTGRPLRTFVVDTSFPADDRSLGYERGVSISPTWHAAITKAAISTAIEVVNRLPLLAGFEEGAPDREEAIKDFLLRFAREAYRRPLTRREEQLYGKIFFTNSANPETTIRRSIILILTSPSFLYTDLTPADRSPSPYTVASRLSLALWDSIPDRPLLEAARYGELATPGQLRAQARRMMADPRAQTKMRHFFDHWLELEYRDLTKDKNLFPGFTDSAIRELRHSLDLFLERVVWSEPADYRQLLLADYLMLNEPLLEFYRPNGGDETIKGSAGVDEGSGTDFEPVVFGPERRAGVLTHPYLLSAFAYHNNTSPIHRGVFLTRNVIGRELKPPPMAVAFKDEEFETGLTMREKITQLTRDTACMSCHSVINPLGFALENYDAVGRWRTLDNNKPVDTQSDYVTAAGETLQVASARDIAEFAVSSDSAHSAFVIQLFEHLVKQTPGAYGLDTVDRLRSQFKKDDFNIQNLMVNIAVLSAGYEPKENEKDESKS